MAKKAINKPTNLILRMAHKAPGGVIRWKEARDLYLKGSESARDEEKGEQEYRQRGGKPTSGRHYHLSLSRLLERHFEPVAGGRGLHVLKSSIEGDTTDDILDVDQYEWERAAA